MSETPPDGSGCTIAYSCASPEHVNILLANRNPANLVRAEAALGVALTVQGNVIQIQAPDAATQQRCLDFFSALDAIYARANRTLSQCDFESTLSAARAGRTNLLRTFYDERIRVSPRKRDVVVRTLAQLNYIRLIREKEIVFGIGPAGTGKTYLAMAMAVHALLEGQVQRLIFTRPAREAGENLGFLPGTLEEKIMPYLRPLYDALYDMMAPEEAQQLMERRVIEVAPLAFMRGRTLNGAFIILDEAQNTTPDQMLMFLTRMGFDSKCVVTGDPMQTDLPRTQVSGLLHARNHLARVNEIGFLQFENADIVRHMLVEKIINAWE